MLKLNAFITLLLISLGCITTSAAQQSTTNNVQGLAQSCFNCHGTDGRSAHPSIGSLAGKPAIQLRQQLQAFSSDNPPAYTTVMNRLVQGLSTEEINALALYFSQLPAQKTEAAQ